MKKVIFSGCIILIFVSMVLMSYAAMKKEPISSSNFSDLKGKWEGWRTGGVSAQNLRTELEIYNDTPPFKGKLTFHDVQRRGMMSGTHTTDFSQGTINDEGNLILKSGQNVFEFSLYRDERKMKLEGDFYFMGFKGTMTLNKK